MKRCAEVVSKRRAVFLDRDGTINEERNYVYREEDFVLIPGAAEAIALLNDRNFLVIVVSNQSGIGRGYFTTRDVDSLHTHLDEVLQAAGAHIDAYYYCPHHPRHGVGDYLIECDCRKPLPGMLLQAADELCINLSDSYMVGDKRADVQAGSAAGCTSLLVRTGNGAAEEQMLTDPVPVFDDLPSAVRWIDTREQASHNIT